VTVQGGRAALRNTRAEARPTMRPITLLACALLLGAAAEEPGRLLVPGSLVDEADAAKPGDLWLCIGREGAVFRARHCAITIEPDDSGSGEPLDAAKMENPLLLVIGVEFPPAELQVPLGHGEAGSTRRYVRLADEGLVAAIRPRVTGRVPIARRRAADMSRGFRRRSFASSHPRAGSSRPRPSSRLARGSRRCHHRL
jgi:hypothetical protein